MDFSTNRIKRFVDRVPTSVLLSILVLPSTGIAVSLSTNWTAGSNNTRSLLSALAGAQAGVLAIVFSVTIIGIQLIGSRYSPRMVSTFTEQPIFRFTFGLFVSSIALDLWLLYNVPDSSTAWHTAGVFAASGLATATAYSLFVFVQEATKQSTPEGAIDAFVSGMTANRYLKQVEQSVENGTDDAHPMRPLYSLIMNALSQGERVTAERAIREYGELVQKILNQLEKENVFSESNPRVIDELFAPVLKEHMVEITIHAEEKDEGQIVRQAAEWQYKLGNDGLELSIDSIARQARMGLSNTLREAPVETSLIASNNAWEKTGELLADAAKQPNLDLVWGICSSVDDNVIRQLWSVEDIRWYQNSMMRLYNNFEKAHSLLLGHYNGYLADVDMDWQHDHVPDDYPNRDEVRAVFQLKEALLETTTHFLRHKADHGEYPITEGNFKDTWKNICIRATKSEADDYAIVLCQALIEIAFVHMFESPNRGISWSNTLGRVSHEGDSEIVEAAFERILDYNYEEEEPGLFFVGEMEQHYQRYYRNQIRLQEYSPLNNHPDFKRIIESIRSDSLDMKNRLKEYDD